MDTWVWIVIAVAAAVVVLGVMWGATRTRRTPPQQERAGDDEVEAAGRRDMSNVERLP